MLLRRYSKSYTRYVNSDILQQDNINIKELEAKIHIIL